MELKFVRILMTVLRLGPRNVLRKFNYMFGLTLPFSAVKRLSAEVPKGEFFRYQREIVDPDHVGWNTTGKQFFFHKYALNSNKPPNWYKDPISGVCLQKPNHPWFHKSYDDLGSTDIKSIWDVSRFSWSFDLALKGDVKKLNQWLNDWCVNNPPFKGLNWKCGQEVAIRVMHLALAALTLKQVCDAQDSLLDYVELSLNRIKPTLSYSIAQDNNHGFSEAAALFIGGAWLEKNGRLSGLGFSKLGRRWLENRVARLIAEDGATSQYSTFYHRAILDILWLVETIRLELNQEKFSTLFYKKAKLACDWLYLLTDESTGHASVIGANDGTMLFSDITWDYLDMRQSLKRAIAAFHHKIAFETVSSATSDNFCKPYVEEPYAIPAAITGELGGTSILYNNVAKVVFRLPNFRFRPSQADVFHVDLWHSSCNVLRDGGSYSYVACKTLQNYFGGESSHNSIQFDEIESMQKISKFLFSNWLKLSSFKAGYNQSKVLTSIEATTKFPGNNLATRLVSLTDKYLQVTDDLMGGFDEAIIRWRLVPDDWTVNGAEITSKSYKIIVHGGEVSLEMGLESLHYHDVSKISVLVVKVKKPGRVTMTLLWL